MDDPQEFSIPVMIDVRAASREQAAQIVVDTLAARGGLLAQITETSRAKSGDPDAVIESWWLPEPDLKHLDGNDNDALLLVEASKLLDLDEQHGLVAEWIRGESDRRRALAEELVERIADRPVSVRWTLFGPRVIIG